MTSSSRGGQPNLPHRHVTTASTDPPRHLPQKPRSTRGSGPAAPPCEPLDARAHYLSITTLARAQRPTTAHAQTDAIFKATSVRDSVDARARPPRGDFCGASTRTHDARTEECLRAERCGGLRGLQTASQKTRNRREPRAPFCGDPRRTSVA